MTISEKIGIIKIKVGWKDLKIGIVPNEIKDKGFIYTKKIAGKLSEFADVYLHEKVRGIEGMYKIFSKEDLYKNCDVIIALGGDGTLLAVAHDAAHYDKAVLGINLGRLGFLSGSESEQFLKKGYKKLTEEIKIEERMMIEAEILHADGEKETVSALNDIVIKRVDFARMESIDVFIGDELLGNYLSDGIIVSTPTGTTAYSLSAGGPIADPELEAMIVTPVCPHLLRARPIVVPATKTITISKPFDTTDISAVTADGKESCPLNGGDKVLIRKSKLKTRLLKIAENGFYSLLSEKLK